MLLMIDDKLSTYYHNLRKIYVLLMTSEGLFNNYISQQNYEPKWTAIEGVSVKGKSSDLQ